MSTTAVSREFDLFDLRDDVPTGHGQLAFCVPPTAGQAHGAAPLDLATLADGPAQSELRPVARTLGQGEILLDANELALRVGQSSIRLTRTQFSILAYLVQNCGRWVTTGELISQVLGTHHRPNTSLVRVHVHAIRRRLGDDARRLETDQRRARGYRWLLQAESHGAQHERPGPERPQPQDSPSLRA